ncbi:MAG: PPC domain-containing protein [Pirellulales bacterium]
MRRQFADLRRCWPAGLLFVGLSASACAQLPHAKLDWIYPPGGQRGTQVDISVGGTDLDEARELIFSHPEIVARPRRTPADEFYADGQPIANQFTMEIGADVPPGSHEVRAVGRHGVSTVRVFHVTDLAEAPDGGNNHAIEQAQLVALESVITGRTEADQEDYYAVELSPGDELTCEIWAQRIDSQANMWIEVCRADGAPLEAQRRWKRRDPVLRFTAPEAGKYFIRVHDGTFRGGDPFIYRLAIHNRGGIDYVLPPAAMPETEFELTLFGKAAGGTPASDTGASSTQQRTVRVAVPTKVDAEIFRYPAAAQPREVDAERFAYAFPEAAPASDEIWLGFASADVVPEQPANDTPEQAQRVAAPGELAGQFFPEGDIDWIEVQPEEAGEMVFEVFSHRLGLPTDPQLVISRLVTDPQGVESLEQVAEADSGEVRPATPGYNTASEDPHARLMLEKDTRYRIMVRDQNSLSRADPSNVYRLVIRRPQPDFQLLAAPVSPWAASAAIPARWPLTVRAGGALAIPVIALRHDGFSSDIVVSAEGLPPGLTCEPVTIRAGKTEAQLVLMAAPDTAEWVGNIHMAGESQVGEARVRKAAVAASLAWDTTTANYDRSRLNRQLVIAVTREAAPVSVRCEGAKWETTPGGVLNAKLTVAVRAELKEALSLIPIRLPEGVTAKVTLAEDQKSAELELTVGEKVPPGAYDFVVAGKPKIVYQNNPEAAARASEDQARIAKLVEGFKSEREQLVTAAGAAPDATSPEIKQIDDRLARGEAALKEATERAAALTAAAQPTERQCEVVSNVGTLSVIEKAKE